MLFPNEIENMSKVEIMTIKRFLIVTYDWLSLAIRILKMGLL